MQPIASLVALALFASGPAPTSPPPPPPPAVTPSEAPGTTVPTPVQPSGTTAPEEPPPPTITPKPTQPGTPKRVYMPGARKEEVVMPTAVEPTPVKPTPVLPTGPQPVLPGTDPDDGGTTTTQPPVNDDDSRRRPRRERRPRGVRVEASTDGSPTGRCFAPQERCRSLVITGIALSAVGVGIAGGGAALLAQPLTPLRSDPTQVKSFRPPGAAMVALGGAALVAGIAVIAVAVVGHKRDQSLRRQAAWWRPRFSAGIVW